MPAYFLLGSDVRDRQSDGDGHEERLTLGATDLASRSRVHRSCAMSLIQSKAPQFKKSEA